MLVEIIGPARERLRPLFAGFPGLHGCVDAIVEGTMGVAYADSAEQPTMALIELDFYLLGGDARSADAEPALRDFALPASVIAGSSWEPLLRRVWGDAARTRTRVAFRSNAWDRRRLRSFIDALPAGMAVCRIEPREVARFAALADSLVYNFPSLEAFAERGVGFGIERDGRFISGCSSFAISSRSLEFEIQTHPDFRRRGLAAATAATMIEYCLDAGLEPCWDAHNEISAALAEKLGFVDATAYTAYELSPAREP